MFGLDEYINIIMCKEDACRSFSGCIVLPQLKVIVATISAALLNTAFSQVLTGCNTLATHRTTDVDLVKLTSHLIQSPKVG